jgi:hypothetical protein
MTALYIVLLVEAVAVPLALIFAVSSYIRMKVAIGRRDATKGKDQG